MVNLPMEKFQVALSRVLQVSNLSFLLRTSCVLGKFDLLSLEFGSQGPSQSGPVLSPSEVLIAIHSIDPARDGIPLKQVCLDHFLYNMQQIDEQMRRSPPLVYLKFTNPEVCLFNQILS